MSKLFGFIKKHVIASLAICLGAVALIVSGTLFIVSAVQYDQYGKDYEVKRKRKPSLLICLNFLKKSLETIIM